MDFLRMIIVDSLSLQQSSKSAPVIDLILEVGPSLIIWVFLHLINGNVFINNVFKASTTRMIVSTDHFHTKVIFSLPYFNK